MMIVAGDPPPLNGAAGMEGDLIASERGNSGASVGKYLRHGRLVVEGGGCEGESEQADGMVNNNLRTMTSIKI